MLNRYQVPLQFRPLSTETAQGGPLSLPDGDATETKTTPLTTTAGPPVGSGNQGTTQSLL